MVADHHALGLAGTARGVDDVGGVRGLHHGQGNGRLQVGGVLWGMGCRTPGVREGEQRRHVDRGHFRALQQGARGLVHHHGAGLCGRQDALDACCRLLDVQRQVGGAGTLDGVQAHHHARAAGQGHGHNVTWLHASLHQAAGGRIHLGVEGDVVQAFILHAQGFAAGVLPAGLTHQGHQRGVRHRVGGVVDDAHPVAQLLVVQGRHGAQGVGLQGGTQEGQQACRVSIDVLGCVEARVGFHL